MISPTIRPAARADAAEINRIYNHYVRRTTATFDTEPWSLARREAWMAEFAPPHFLLVAAGGGGLAGFAFNRGFRPKPAYSQSTETTVYTDGRARGAGGALYENLFARIEASELHRAFAVIALPNPGSVAFHRRFGFRHIGTLSEAGCKFGRYIDTAWFEKVVESPGVHRKQTPPIDAP
ncbi:MAG: GNAT family N-acetyltransferase [Gammaproteobacteria bacterium]